MDEQAKPDSEERHKIGDGNWQPGELRVGTPSDDQLKAIGRIVTSFAYLEVTVKSCIWCLVGNDQAVGRIVTEQKASFGSLLSLLSALHQLRVPENSAGQRGQLLELLRKRLSQADEKRNAIVHSVWLLDGITPTAMRTKAQAKAKTGLRDQFERADESDLNAIADFIEDVAFETGEFWNGLQFYPHRKDSAGNFPAWESSSRASRSGS